jgi:glutamate-1-semialdehyde 2,1-aminomutase
MTTAVTSSRTTTRSAALFEEAQRHLPGGVNSPVRAFRGVGGTPRFIQRAQGSRVWDADGNEYIDYVASWGPLIAGHAHPAVVQAIQEAAPRGTSYGAPTEAEVRLAELVKIAFPAIELVRFVNSGTEATMSALRLARGATGRELIVKFDGGYHGHADGLLVQAGSGPLTLGAPDSPGVPAAAAAQTLSIPFNDLAAVSAAFDEHPQQIAALILEPVAGNMGVIPPVAGFLEGLRALCTKHGTLLIFDEVITGFRLAWGGAQEYFGLTHRTADGRNVPRLAGSTGSAATGQSGQSANGAQASTLPDLVCLGKIVGGGLPVGAYGGRRDLMERIAPLGPVYQAGTLSGNPLAMAAGLATLELLRDPAVYQRLDALAVRLQTGLGDAASAAGIPYRSNRAGSMLTGFFTDTPVTDYTSAKKADTARYARFFHALLDRGVYFAPSQFEAAFVSLAHTEADIAHTLTQASEVMRSLA